MSNANRSHVGPIITYLARAPNDITQWQPGTEYVAPHIPAVIH